MCESSEEHGGEAERTVFKATIAVVAQQSLSSGAEQKASSVGRLAQASEAEGG
jgi:hypothetical protein